MRILKLQKKKTGTEKGNFNKKLLFVDQPKVDIKEDKFKHNIYVTALEEVLIKCQTPINIGIFGKWGVGKTTIINFLKKQIEDNKSLKDEIRFLDSFDVWKYSGDSFRRQLLLHLNESLPKGERIKDIEDKLYAVTEEEKEGKFKFSKKGVFYSVIMILILVTLAAYFNYKGLANSMLPLVLIPLFLLLIQRLDNVLKTVMIKKIIPRVESPEEFEKLFGTLLEKFNSNKVVIPIDNLDRCEQGVVLDTLGTIKTFLEKPKCIFIIPCDDEAIKDYINRMRSQDGIAEKRCEDGQEFLRKFFQASIRIPFYLEDTLENYTNEIFSEIELAHHIGDELRRRVMQVAMSAYTKNPRRIKRFLNNLSILWILAREKEKAGIITSNLITRNIDFLAKISIIEEDWYDFYKYLKDDNGALDLIASYIEGDQIGNKEEKIKKFLIEEEYPGLKRFLIATKIIGVDVRNIRSFLALNQEAYQSLIDELDEFQTKLRDGDLTYFADIFEKANEEKKRSYEKEMERTLRYYHEQGYNIYAFNVLNVIISVYDKISDKELISRIASDLLSTSELREYLPKFDINGALCLLKDSPNINKNRVLRNYFELTKTAEHKEEVLNSFITNSDLLPASMIRDLRLQIIEDYKKSPEETVAYIEKMESDKNAREIIIDSKIIKDVVASIDEKETDKNNKKVELFYKLKHKSSPEVRTFFVEKMIDIIEGSNVDSYNALKSYGLEKIKSLELADISEQVLEKLHSCFKNQYNQMAQPEDKLKFIEAMLRFMTSFKDEHREDLVRSCIIHFINSYDVASVNHLMEMLMA